MKRFLMAGMLIGLLAAASLAGWLMSTFPLVQSHLTHNSGMRARAYSGFGYGACSVNIVVRVGDIVVIKVRPSGDEESDCHDD